MKKTNTHRDINKKGEQHQPTEAKVSAKRRMAGKKAAETRQMNPIQKMTRKIDMQGMGETMKKTAKKIDPNTVAKGAAVVSVAAGAVAAGALMMDEKNRRFVGKNASKGMEVLKTIATDMMEQGQTRYQAAAHTVTGGGEKKKTSSQKKTRSKSKK